MLNTYDALFILSNSLKEEDVENVVARIGEEIVKMGGSVVDTEQMGRRYFARTMKKRESGYYVRLRVSIDGESVSPFTDRMKLNDNVFRLQVTKAQDFAPREVPVE